MADHASHVDHLCGAAFAGAITAAIAICVAFGLHWHTARALRMAEAAAAVAADATTASLEAESFEKGVICIAILAITLTVCAIGSLVVLGYAPTPSVRTPPSRDDATPKKAPITAPTPCCCHEHGAAAETVPCKEAS